MSASATLRAGIYGRESKDKQKSIDSQIAESREAALEHGWDIVAEYTDGVSASRFGTKVRRGWKRLLVDLDAGALDVVIAWEPSRADRDLETWVSFVAKCRARGVRIHVTGDGDTLDPANPSHWQRLIHGGVDAAMESEKISRRVLRGVSAAAVSGGFHGDTPYGYERIIVGERPTPHGPKPVKEQRPHPGTAPVVREIFERIARQDPIVHVVADLNQRGVPAPGGGATWHRATIRKLIRNKAYVGQREHAGQTYDAVWKALVVKTTFYAANKVLDMPDRKKTRPGRLKWMLTYLAVGGCGGRLHAQPVVDGRRARYHCVTDGCVSIGVTELDELLSSAVIARLSKPDARDLFFGDDEVADAARGEAVELSRRLDEWRESARRGETTPASLAVIEQGLLVDIDKAEKAATAASAPAVMAELLDAATFGQQKVRPVWDSLPVPAKREVVGALFAEIRVTKPAKRLSRWATDEQRLDAAAQRVVIEWRRP